MLRLTILQGPGWEEILRIRDSLKSQLAPREEVEGFVVQIDDGDPTPATLTMIEVDYFPEKGLFLVFDFLDHRFADAEYDPTQGCSNEVFGRTLEEDLHDYSNEH